MARLVPLLLFVVHTGCVSFRYHTAYGTVEAENEFADVVVRFRHLKYGVGVLEVRNNEEDEIQILWDEAAAVWNDGLQRRLTHGLASATNYQSVDPQPVFPGAFVREPVGIPSRCAGRKDQSRPPNLKVADTVCPEWRDERVELHVPFVMNDHQYKVVAPVAPIGVHFYVYPSEKERQLELYERLVLDR